MGLLALVVTLVFSAVAVAAPMPSWGNSEFPYGAHFDRLLGDLSASGLAGVDERPAFLNRWEAYFEDFVTKKTNYLDRYDVFNIQEVSETDDFTDRRGYGLIPLKEKVVKDFVRYANGNPDFVWDKVKQCDTKRLLLT